MYLFPKTINSISMIKYLNGKMKKDVYEEFKLFAIKHAQLAIEDFIKINWIQMFFKLKLAQAQETKLSLKSGLKPWKNKLIKNSWLICLISNHLIFSIKNSIKKQMSKQLTLNHQEIIKSFWPMLKNKKPTFQSSIN